MRANRLLALTLGLFAGLLIANRVRMYGIDRRLTRAIYPTRTLNRAEIRAALAQGADPNAKTVKDVRVLSWVARDGDLETMRLLLDAGADPNCTGGWLPALNMAVGDGQVDAVELLLERGADPNNDRKNDRESWALVLAVTSKRLEITRLLLKHGANPNSHDHKATVLEVARKHGPPALVALLNQAGAK